MSEYTVQRFRGGYAVAYTAIAEDGKAYRRRERLYATDRPSAESEARSRWQNGQGGWTVGRIVEAYIDDREADGIASTSRQRDAWKAMKPFWENVDPALIDREMAQKYAAERGMSDSTLRYELGMLSVALRRAEDAGHIAKARKVWRPEAPERQEKALTPAQFNKFLDAVKAPHAKLYVELGIATMARPTAILELTWDRVDFERGTVDLNPKGRRQTRKRRPVVPLGTDALEALKLAYEGRQCANVIERGAKPVKSIKKAFQAASERSGIHVTPYTLRHTGAVWAAESGMSMDELAQFMGHDDSATTSKHYARYSPGHLRRVANAVQEARKTGRKVQS